jgi:hypothetical protein
MLRRSAEGATRMTMDEIQALGLRLADPKEGLHRVIRDQVLADAQVLYAA